MSDDQTGSTAMARIAERIARIKEDRVRARQLRAQERREVAEDAGAAERQRKEQGK